MPKAKGSPLLKRAASTPQMNSAELQDSGGLSPSAIDKRRNKLGYQRISIACGKYPDQFFRIISARKEAF